MSAFTTVRSGAWNDTSPETSPWGGAGPGNGDTVTIANGTVLTIPPGYEAVIGTSPADDTGTPAIQCASASGTGRLIVQGTLRYKGPLRQANATWEVHAGGRVIHDSSAAAAPATANYSWNIAMASGQLNSKLVITGTAAQPVTFETAPGSGNAGPFGNTTVSWSPGGRIEAAWCTFSKFGSATKNAVRARLANNAAYAVTFDNCTFDQCGPISVVNVDGQAGYRLKGVKVANPLGNGTIANDIGMGGTIGSVVSGSAALSGAGFRVVEDSYLEAFYAYFATAAAPAALTIRNVVFAGSSTYEPVRFPRGTAGNEIAVWENVLIHHPNTASGLPVNMPAGLLKRTILLRGSTVNPHFVTVHTSGRNSTYDTWILENPNSDEGGDGFQVESNPLGPQVLTVRNCILLPNGGDTVSCSLVSLTAGTGAAGVPNQTVIADKNTFYARQVAAGGIIAGIGSELNGLNPGTFASIRSNIAWRNGTGNGWIVRPHSAWAPVDGAFQQVDYNAKWGLTTSGYEPGVSKFANPSPPGGHDIVADPQFIDKDRDFLKWGQSVDPAVSSWADIVGRIRNGVAGFTIANAIDYIRGGFAPQNAAYKGAAHDGSDIGAVAAVVPVLPGGSTAIGLFSLFSEEK